jgi:predicted ABC-type ATPase
VTSGIGDLLRGLAQSGDPILVVLAGPNGAGKSTFYKHFLRAEGLPFINADLIAAELGSGDPVAIATAATRLANRYREELLEQKSSFIFETVFSDPVGDKVAFLRRAQNEGYRVLLVFIGLTSAAASQARVIERVARGGHDVPDDKLHSRFPRSLANLSRAIETVDFAMLFDNSKADQPFRYIAAFERGELVDITALRPSWLAKIVEPFE